MSNGPDGTVETGMPPLSFSNLSAKISAVPDFNDGKVRSPAVARWAFAIGLIAFVCTFPLRLLSLTPTASLIANLILLAIEIGGVGTHVWKTRYEIASSFSPFKDFADQLDHDISYHYVIREWLLSHTTMEVRRFADFSAFRRERFSQRFPLLFGSVPSLGILPIAGAVYYQVREVANGRHVGIFEGTCIAILFMLYLLSWSLALTKSRLDVMDMFLQDALGLKEADEELTQTDGVSLP